MIASATDSTGLRHQLAELAITLCCRVVLDRLNTNCIKGAWPPKLETRMSAEDKKKQVTRVLAQTIGLNLLRFAGHCEECARFRDAQDESRASRRNDALRRGAGSHALCSLDPHTLAIFGTGAGGAANTQIRHRERVRLADGRQAEGAARSACRIRGHQNQRQRQRQRQLVFLFVQLEWRCEI